VSHPRIVVFLILNYLLHIFSYSYSSQTQTTRQSTNATFAGEETPQLEVEYGSQEK
jgi:hypothetical protein